MSPSVNTFELKVMISNVSRTMTEHQLNMSCTVAPEKARLTVSLSLTCVIATRVLVTDVPMLAPMTMGTAMWTSRAPAVTMDTTMEVKVELLCTATVP